MEAFSHTILHANAQKLSVCGRRGVMSIEKAVAARVVNYRRRARRIIPVPQLARVGSWIPENPAEDDGPANRSAHCCNCCNSWFSCHCQLSRARVPGLLSGVQYREWLVDVAISSWAACLEAGDLAREQGVGELARQEWRSIKSAERGGRILGIARAASPSGTKCPSFLCLGILPLFPPFSSLTRAFLQPRFCRSYLDCIRNRVDCRVSRQERAPLLVIEEGAIAA